MMWPDALDPGWFWLIGIGQFVFWAALIVVAASLLRNRPRQPPQRPTQSAAVAVLEERYARGEIDRDEFLERRSVLIEQSGRS